MISPPAANALNAEKEKVDIISIAANNAEKIFFMLSSSYVEDI